MPAYADYAAITSSESSELEEEKIENKVVELPARLAVFAMMSYSQEDQDKSYEVPLTKAERKKLKAKEKQKVEKKTADPVEEPVPLKKLEIIRPQLEKTKSAPSKPEKK